MPRIAEIHCPHCHTEHGNLTEPHHYEPDLRYPLDPVTGQRPCSQCGRFKGSYLHPKEANHG